MTAVSVGSRRTISPVVTPVLVLLGLACLASWGLVVVLGTRLTFFNDDWYFLLQRPGLESHAGLASVLAPHNSNLVVLTAAGYKLLVAVFGLGSQLPFRIVLGAATVAVGVMVFVLVRRRAGPAVALAGSVLVLFLGAAWEDLLFYGAAIDIAGSLSTGLAALWLLEREPARPVPACLLLVCSIGFSNVGVPFALGALIQILLRRRPVELWVVAVPIASFVLWWALEGSGQPSHLSGTNLVNLPRYVFDSLSSGLASLAGLHGGTSSGMRIAGRSLFGVAVVAIAVALWRGWRPRTSVLVPAVTVLGFWCLTGASFYAGREPFASRYQLIDVTLLIWIGADLVGMVRLGRVGGAGLALVTVAIVASGIADRLSFGYRFLRTQSQFVQADLGALELGRRLAPRDLWLVAQVAHNPYLSGITAGRFFAQTDAHGRVSVYSVAQIAAAPPDQRLGADNVLALAERLTPRRVAAARVGRRRCAEVRVEGTVAGSEVALSPGRWLLAEPRGGGLAIGVRRFAPAGSHAVIGLIKPGVAEEMTVPADAVPAPWRLGIRGPASGGVSVLRVCPV